VRVFVGGIIPESDVPRLMEIGVSAVYGPGASTQSIVEEFRQALAKRD
jgi:methylmalonyl-CoA mutase C-terminal domain/subunit